MADLTGDVESALGTVKRLLELAHARGASDLHLIPTEGGLDVRARIHGILVDVGAALPDSLARFADDTERVSELTGEAAVKCVTKV